MNIYLAPMEGITGYIVRNAFLHNFGGIDKYFTPFIPAAKRMSRKILSDIAPEHNAGIHLVPQLISCVSGEILDMIRQLKDHGFSEVNINLGCPSGTVVNKRRGSGLLLHPDELDRFLDGIYEKADIPVSIKTRIGFNNVDEWPRLLSIFRQYPISELIIHPRLRCEMYSGNPHLEAYKLAYELYQNASGFSPCADSDGTCQNPITCKTVSSKETTLCYNGDIWDMGHYRQISASFPKTDTVMIGRGLLAKPYLANMIKSSPQLGTGSGANRELRGSIRSFWEEIYDGYLGIFDSEKDAAMHMKEIWGFLGASFKDSEEPVKKLLKSTSPLQFRLLSLHMLDTLELADYC